MRLHGIGVAVAGNVDPHVHVVVSHGSGQYEVEFLPANQVENLGPIAGRSGNLMGAGGGSRQHRDKKEQDGSHSHRAFLGLRGFATTYRFE